MFSILRQASKIANPMVNLIYANLRRPYAGFKVNPKPSCCQSWRRLACQVGRTGVGCPTPANQLLLEDLKPLGFSLATRLLSGRPGGRQQTQQSRKPGGGGLG